MQRAPLSRYLEEALYKYSIIECYITQHQWLQLQQDRHWQTSETTCNPSLMDLVTAPVGKTVWTWGTTVELMIPPFWLTIDVSCRMRVTIAKYLGKSDVMMRVMRRWYRSSALSRSRKNRNWPGWGKTARRIGPVCYQRDRKLSKLPWSQTVTNTKPTTKTKTTTSAGVSLYGEFLHHIWFQFPLDIPKG